MNEDEFKRIADDLRGSHDLRLSAWGPYTKRYMGISHIPEVKAGLRFDVSVVPGLYRRGIQLPNVLWESGYHPWEAAPDLSYFRHRHEVIWKDQVFCDVDFCRMDETSVLVRAACTNRTDQAQNLVLHLLASLHFPPQRTNANEALRMWRVKLPEGAVWVEALAYTDLILQHEGHRANLSYDGLTRGEIRAHGFVNGLGLGQGFGLHKGDSVTYQLSIPKTAQEATLVMRYRMQNNTALTLTLSGLVERKFTMVGTGNITEFEIPIAPLPQGESTLTLSSQGGATLQLDGLAIVPSTERCGLQFEAQPWNPVPERIEGPRDDTLILQYEHVDAVYGLAWGSHDGTPTPFQVREFFCDDLDNTIRYKVHDHVHDKLYGPGDGHFTDVFIRPIFLPPTSTHVFYGYICSGDPETVRTRLVTFDASAPDLDGRHAQARATAVDLHANPSGQPYQFSQEKMAATVLTNVVYPVRTRGTWIRHATPGRWWDSLYTWDSGFIGLGLAELDLDRAIDNLNAYVTEPGTKDAAFIHHGSPVPTQFYVFQALWNQSQSQALLTYFYPRLQQYHRFMAGRLGSSTTRDLKSNLIRTWDYFYNSGGWDDYPPQAYVHQQGLEASVTPVISSAQVIRTAKILRMAAVALGLDTAEYDEDIATLSHALQTWAWDEDAGYFGYVCHDESGEPQHVLQHSSGANFNMGMDGASPLVADICTPEQERRLVKALMSSERMWCRCGLSTVDQSAPYYRDDGYWNGAVWMPHQWFFWKALLDLGYADEAHRIAKTALDVWQKEVETSYNCFEHFLVQTGRGAGWHHFGGLSSPVLCWYSAYHRPGRLTVGLNTWVESLTIAPDHSGLTASLKHYGAPHHAPVVVATLKPDTYTVTWNGNPTPYHARYPGTQEIQLPQGASAGTLTIKSASA